MKRPSRTIRPGDWCRETFPHSSALVGYVGKVIPPHAGNGPERGFYVSRDYALLDNGDGCIGYAHRDSIIRCPGECRCGSRNVTMTTVYPFRGTAPGGRGRLGDPGATGVSECNDCGRSWVTSS